MQVGWRAPTLQLFFALFLLSHNFFLSLSRRGLPPKTLKSGVVGVMLAALLKLIVGAGE